MSDEGLTAKAKFEPPPWEREAFEALAARRAEEQAVLEAAEAAENEGLTAPIQEPDATPEVATEIQPVVAVDETAAAVVEVEAAASPAPALDDRMVEAMLVQLQNEERIDGRATRTIGQVASVVTFLLGSAMLITGLVMAGQAAGKSIAVIGSLVLSVFGLCFIGMAVWVWVTTSRSRGR